MTNCHQAGHLFGITAILSCRYYTGTEVRKLLETPTNLNGKTASCMFLSRLFWQFRLFVIYLH